MMIQLLKGRHRRNQRRQKKRNACRRNLQACLEKLEPRRVLASVSLDQIFADSISVSGETDLFTLEISDPRSASFTVNATPLQSQDLGGGRLVLRAPDNTVIVTSDVEIGNPQIRDLELAASGVYTIEVSAPVADPNRVGDYELHLADRNPSPQTIDFGQSMTGTIGLLDGVQSYSIDISTEQLDSPFSVALDGDGVLRPKIDIFAPNGDLFSESDSGRYVYDTRIADFTPLVIGDAANANARYQSALGDNAFGANDVDLYRVDLSQGDLLVAGIGAQSVGLSGLDGVLRIFDAQGNQQSINDDTAMGADPAIVFSAPESGVYFIGVSSDANDGYDPHAVGSGSSGLSTGAYQLLLSRSAVDENPGVDVGDTLATANVLNVAAGSTRHLQATVGDGTQDTSDVDLFRVDLEPGEILSAGVVADQIGLSNLNAYLRLFDAGGNPILANDDLIGTDSSIIFPVTVAGTYYLGVSSSGNTQYDVSLSGSGTAGTSEGDYQLIVSRSTYSGTLAEDVSETLVGAKSVNLSDDSGRQADSGTYTIRVTGVTDDLGSFELGVSDRPIETPQAAEFSAFGAGYLDRLGDEDAFTLTGQAGDQITVSVTGTGFTPDLQLIGPDGQNAASGDYDTNVTVTLPEDGTYTALVRGGGPASIGNGPYLISVSDPQPAPIPIGFGERLAGEVHVPGDFVEFELSVSVSEVGKSVSIVHSTVTNFSGSYRSVLELYAPDGSQLESTVDY
ncbi:hypothetical protein CKO51_20775, partial [Rhodopirellula sp. SM50]